MKRSLIGLVGVLVACGGSSEPPVEEVTFGDDEVVEGQTDAQKLRALFEAEIDGMRSADADAALASHALDADSFMLGPVARSVMVGGPAVEGAVRQVMSSWQPMEVRTEEHVFEVVGDAAFSAHTVTFDPTGEAPITYHAVQVYAQKPQGWQVAATSWTIAMPQERWVPMAQSGALPDSAPIPARRDAGCETMAADLEQLRIGQMPGSDRVVGSFSLGTQPDEARPLSQEEYDTIKAALDAGTITNTPGPGEVYAQRVGELCFGVVSVVRTGQMDGQELRLPTRAAVVFDTRSDTHRLASFSMVLPEGPPPGAEEPEGDPAATDLEAAPPEG